jgi:hypothetical protein
MWWGWCCTAALVNAYPTRASTMTWWRKPTGFFLFSWLLLLSIKTRRSVAAADALISGGGIKEGWEKPHDEVRMFVKFGCVLRDVNVSTSDARPPSAPHDDVRRPSQSRRGFFDFLIFSKLPPKTKCANQMNCRLTTFAGSRRSRDKINWASQTHTSRRRPLVVCAH